ncbi:MAG: TetR/AcrR family transcriptional regulator [Moraxellaceae bacterium]
MRKKPIQQRSRQMVNSIIEATGRVIADGGLDAFNTNRVAELAGISNGSLYQYFHDRTDLMEALLEKVGGDLMQSLNQVSKQIDVLGMELYAVVKLSLTQVLTFLRSDKLYPELIRNWHRLPLHRLLEPVEQYLLTTSRLYLQHRYENYPLKHLQTKLYVLVNGALFTMLRFLTQDNPFMKEEEVINCLVENIVLSLEVGAQTSPTAAP